MPAAAVIPAPIAYIKVVAVKTLVVEFQECDTGWPQGMYWRSHSLHSEDASCLSLGELQTQNLYLEKIRVFKAGVCLNTLAWNNRIGLWFYFVGF